jgi:phenylalanyl-tRNA synthetase beta chain
MKTSLNWLNACLDQPVTVDDVARLLPDVGFPIDSREAIADSANRHDVRMEVEVTSNRGDCLSHVGLAREVAAAAMRTVKLPDCTPPVAVAERADAVVAVSSREQTLCPLYTARVIRGVKVGPSPAWLMDRLAAVGLRSVNNVVDVTNFVLFELGQPLHAFDLNKLRGKAIIVRRATKGEAFTAIDGTRHTLRDDMLVIADKEAPVAIAGVMGGLDSEVSGATTDIVLESAIFEPLCVRRAARALKLKSDSSYRFERGVDPMGVDLASRRAVKLIIELGGGTLCEGVIRIGAGAPTPRAIDMRIDRCNALLGIALPPAQMVDLLNRLGLFAKLNGGVITCVVPTYRLDLEREVDLIEEVARLHGLNQVPQRDRIAMTVRPVQPITLARRRMRETLIAHGYHETISQSFLAPKLGEPFLPAGDEPVAVSHEVRKGEGMLRPSVLPSLLACRKTNQDVGNAAVKLFETASCWSRRQGKIVERVTLSILTDVAGGISETLRGLAGAIEELNSALGGSKAAVSLAPVDSPHHSIAADVKLNGVAIGRIGVLSDPLTKLFDLQTQVVLAELELPSLLALHPPSRQVGALPRFPGIERDLSVVVADEVNWSEIEKQVRETRPAMLEELRFVTTYRGKPIAAGRKSVTFRLVFRDPRATLRHDQVDPQVAAVVDRLKASVGAELRV